MPEADERSKRWVGGGRGKRQRVRAAGDGGQGVPLERALGARAGVREGRVQGQGESEGKGRPAGTAGRVAAAPRSRLPFQLCSARLPPHPPPPETARGTSRPGGARLPLLPGPWHHTGQADGSPARRGAAGPEAPSPRPSVHSHAAPRGPAGPASGARGRGEGSRRSGGGRPGGTQTARGRRPLRQRTMGRGMGARGGARRGGTCSRQPRGARGSTARAARAPARPAPTAVAGARRPPPAPPTRAAPRDSGPSRDVGGSGSCSEPGPPSPPPPPLPTPGLGSLCPAWPAAEAGKQRPRELAPPLRPRGPARIRGRSRPAVARGARCGAGAWGLAAAPQVLPKLCPAAPTDRAPSAERPAAIYFPAARVPRESGEPESPGRGAESAQLQGQGASRCGGRLHQLLGRERDGAALRCRASAGAARRTSSL